MTFNSENDNGPFETLFRAFEGYNVKLTWEDEEREVQILAANRGSVEVILFMGHEDSPTGEAVEVDYEAVQELAVY